MSQTFVPEDPQRFATAMRRFDEENSRDPNVQPYNGKTVPRELAYSEWLSAWVLRLKPEASEALRLAARSAHLCRWVISRDTYPSTRAGYLRWREALKQFHAQKVPRSSQRQAIPKQLSSRSRDWSQSGLSPMIQKAGSSKTRYALYFLNINWPIWPKKTLRTKWSMHCKKAGRK